jgi:hypothetical protein
VLVKPLAGESSVVNEKLKIEGTDVRAGITLASIVHYHQVNGMAEGDVGIFDHLEEGLPLQKLVP